MSMTDRPGSGRSLKTLVSICFMVDARRASALFALQIVNSLSTVMFAYWLKLITDGAFRADASDVWAGAIGVVGGMVVFQITNWSVFNIQNTLQERTAWVMDKRLIELAAGLPGIEHHERPDYITELEMLRQDRWQLSASLGSLVHNVDTLVQLVGTVALLSRLHPALMFLPICALPSLFLSGKAVGIHFGAREVTREKRRTADHLFELSTTPGPAKELRIFGLGRTIVDRHRKEWDDMDHDIRNADIKVALMATFGWSLFALGYAAAMFFIVSRAVRGLHSAGDVLLAFTLGAQVNEQVSRAIGNLTWMLRNLRTVGRYIWLMDYAASANITSSRLVKCPTLLQRGIDLEGVVFRYPGTDRDVLERLDLHIPAGSTLAIVGDNGAGKTTLVKLLCRFYEPTEGRILVDGIDLQDMSFSEWRSRLSGGFQDFARFEFLAGETVGVGDLRFIHDEEVVARALEHAGGADVIAGLPQGLLTQLGKSFSEGRELSGGQWQKLALGRAMMRDPLMLVLDEPTANLDATTEHALFTRFAAASARASRKNGAITVLVSHRFSTVRMADLIVVVAGGRVLEMGNHSALMSSGGLYAELYELQARAYR
ncbi:MAG: ABC transporter ATP-binding protein [Actinomycetota bacterium]